MKVNTHVSDATSPEFTNSNALPLELRWNGKKPLPVRDIGAPPRPPLMPFDKAPPWLLSGDVNQPFDFCGRVRDLCADIALHCEEFRNIDVSRILVAVTQARNGRQYGLQARVTPLRFPNGELRHCKRGVTYQVQRYFLNDLEFLYLITFCLPRFLDQDFDDKLVTLFHELYHISPDFDGDLRRHQGRYCIHSRSQKAYDKKMAHMAREYLDAKPNADLHAFLRLNFSQLEDRHGSVLGIMVPRPKIIPVRG